MLEWAILVFLLGFVALCAVFLRRGDATAPVFWAAGWVSAGAGVLLGSLGTDFHWLSLASFPLGTLFPALLLAGALRMHQRASPSWLFPAAFALGGVRVLLAAHGRPDLAYALALALEPLVILATAVVAHRAIRDPGAWMAERLLAPSFVALAVAGGVHDAWMMQQGSIAPGLLAFWILAGPPILGVQIQAGSVRIARALRRSRDALEERVRARTAELARANESLRREIAEREAAERAARASEERYRVVSELSSDFSFAFRIEPDLSLRVDWVTGAFQRITGFPPQRLEGHGWLEMMPEEDRELPPREYEEASAAGSPVTLLRRVRRADGELRWLEIRLDTLRSVSDGSLRVVGAARDVSEGRREQEERRHLELQVHEAQKLESLGVLTGGIAHDFNNLLAVILGNARMALSELPEGSPAAPRLERVRAAGEHAADLAEQMLVYSGKRSVERRPLDLAALVGDMLELLRASISEKGRLERRLSVAPLPVEGDATQLRQVVLNLVLNASEALGEGKGTISLATGSLVADAELLHGCFGTPDPRPGRYAFVEVGDDGPGMAAETRRRIFEPFFTTRFSGRGLGLASVLGIVRAHGGVVKVESEVGRGTRMRVLIPLAEGVELPAAEAGQAPPPALPTRRPTRVLVVDDEDWVLELTREFLERAGFSVVCAAGGREGIARFREHAAELDAVVLDIAMPDLDGEQVFLEMHRLRPEVPVLLTTGYSPELAASRFAARGVAGFLRKPFEPEELVERLHAACAPAQPDAGS